MHAYNTHILQRQRNRKRDRQRKYFYLLAHSPTTCNSWDWAWMKTEGWNSIRSSFGWWGPWCLNHYLLLCRMDSTRKLDETQSWDSNPGTAIWDAGISNGVLKAVSNVRFHSQFLNTPNTEEELASFLADFNILKYNVIQIYTTSTLFNTQRLLLFILFYK